jgi:hypothetical protein
MRIKLAALLVALSITAVWNSCRERPRQMVSAVEYDRDIFDPFFDQEESSPPWWIIERDDGSFEDTTGEITEREDIPRMRHTADCRTRHQFPRVIRFAEARRVADGLEIRVHDETASTFDDLTVLAHKGRFSAQYKTRYPADPPDIGLIWTTTKQRLVLDKKSYRPGDVIRGRIEFECLQEIVDPRYGDRAPRKIRIEGPFKPILKAGDDDGLNAKNKWGK